MIRNTSRLLDRWQITLCRTFLQTGSYHGTFDLPIVTRTNSFFFFFFLHRDFNAPSPPADTSAATIAATGLLLLSEMEMSLSPVNTTGRDLWRAEAIQVRRASSAISKRHDPHLGVCLDSSRHDRISMAACMAEFTVEWHC